MRAFEFTQLVEDSEIEIVQSQLTGMGFSDFKRKGNTLFGMVEIPPKAKNKEFRIQKMNDVAAKLSKTLKPNIKKNVNNVNNNIISPLKYSEKPTKIS
jgi:hypothetical protein